MLRLNLKNYVFIEKPTICVILYITAFLHNIYIYDYNWKGLVVRWGVEPLENLINLTLPDWIDIFINYDIQSRAL